MKKFQMAFYKGTRPGVAGVYNRAVRMWFKGKYSHVEVIFSDGMAASASFSDGGVRFKEIDFNDGKWDIIDLPPEWEAAARKYFEDHEGESYDILGNLHFIIGVIPEGRRKKFCSEACGAAIGIEDAWRYEPTALYYVVKRLVGVWPAL